MDSLVAKRNALFERVKRELETANRVKTQKPSLSEVRDRLDRLQQLGIKFFAIQDGIEESTPQATRSIFDYRKEFEDRFYAAKAIYADLDKGPIANDKTVAQPANSLQAAVAALLETQRTLLANQANQAAQLDRLQQGNQQPASQAAAPQAQPDPFVDVGLPLISIPTFLGDRKEKLQPVQKLQYDALETCSSFEQQCFVDDAKKETRMLPAKPAEKKKISARTKVATIQQICVPKLELNGCRLLTVLMKRISRALCHLELQHFAFKDLAIVLEWLSAHPRKWKTFVANRTSVILEFLPGSMWHHCSSNDNQADCASRGITSIELLNHPLRWNSPFRVRTQKSFLEHCAAPAPNAPPLEERQIRTFCLEIGPPRIDFTLECYLLERFSSLRRCARTLAMIKRFLFNLARPKGERLTGTLTPAELKAAGLQLVRLAQYDAFSKEIACLRKSTEVSNKSKLRPLFPFFDRKENLRVGGRLQNADVPYDMKHPPILPQHHRLTTLVIQDLHLDNLHAGPTLVIASRNQRFWVMGFQIVVRQQLQQCFRCYRMKVEIAQQLMGSLPAIQVTPARAFVHVGIDYAGPILIKSGNPRKPQITKGYIVVFVFLCTKAVHLEVVSYLSTKIFIGALKQLATRRGMCTEIWSDNGINFAGADRQLQELFRSDEFKRQAANFAVNIGIRWTFIPPSAPHMGGLWEAAVKRTKYTYIQKLLPLPTN